jgi:hypothetical protein
MLPGAAAGVTVGDACIAAAVGVTVGAVSAAGDFRSERQNVLTGADILLRQHPSTGAQSNPYIEIVPRLPLAEACNR